MLTERKAAAIADLFYAIDIGVRDQLAKDFVTSERDYVSALATNFRYPFGLFNQYTFMNMKLGATWTARSNDASSEQTFGCDSMIVFQVKDQVKVCLFEAKWPRVVKKPKYAWDALQKKSKVSHFTDQINRQSEWSDSAAIWEMFFLEKKPGDLVHPFDKNGSTCVRHQFAKDYIDGPTAPATIWDNEDLEKLIVSSHSDAYTGLDQSNLKEIISDVLTCKFGPPILVKPFDGYFLLRPNKGESVAIPVPNLELNNGNEINLSEFMGSHGLSFFQYMTIEPLDGEQTENE
jgi:hypothetical protein